MGYYFSAHHAPTTWVSTMTNLANDAEYTNEAEYTDVSYTDVNHAREPALSLLEVGGDPVAAVRSGLPYAALERLRAVLVAPDEQIARALAISMRTLSRRQVEGQLTTSESDRLLILAQIFDLASRALDSEEVARRWLQAPHALLGGESPLEHMDTLAGTEEVRTLLYSIEYTMPA